MKKKGKREICLDYQDIFYLPDEVLSSTTVVKRQFRLEPGTELVNAIPYCFYEFQKREVRKQI